MSKKVVVLGTLDTKGNEFKFLKDIIEAQGVKTIVVDAGIFEPTFKPDVSNLEVCKAQGADLAKLREVNDRGTNVLTMMQGAAKIVNALYE